MFTALFSSIFSLITLIFSNLSSLFQASALSLSDSFLAFFSLFHLSVFSSIYCVNHLAIAHFSSNCFFLSFLSLFSWLFLRISSCFFLFSSRSFFLFSSYNSFAFLFSSTSLCICSKVCSSLFSQASLFSLWVFFTSFLVCSSSLLHFFQMFTFISLRSNILCFSSIFTRCLCSCSGSLFQVWVIFIWSSLSEAFPSITCFFLFNASFLFLSVNLSISSVFQVFSFSFNRLIHSLSSFQLFSCFSFSSSFASLILSNSLVSS